MFLFHNQVNSKICVSLLNLYLRDSFIRDTMSYRIKLSVTVQIIFFLFSFSSVVELLMVIELSSLIQAKSYYATLFNL